MMKLKATSEGQVFTDPNDKIEMYYQVTQVREDGVTGTTVKAKSEQTARTFSESEMERLLPTPSDPFIDADLTPLIGKRLRVKTVYGTNTGLCVNVLHQTVIMLGEDVRLDYGVVLSGGEEYLLNDTKSIEVVS